MSSDELWSHCSINMNEQECKKKKTFNQRMINVTLQDYAGGWETVRAF